MEEMEESEIRLAALCKRLGKLWQKKEIIALDGIISAEKVQECKQTLIGKLYLDPKVNFQAFQNIMKRVWRMKNVEINQIALGIYEFRFQSMMDRDKILYTGPWSFANHLLILKPWKPNTPPACYKFDKCMFWLHIHGLPTEWISEDVVKIMAEEMGHVEEVKLEIRGNTSYKVGKAKVTLELSKPLIPGSIYSNMSKNLWLDYRYERLPHYCYSCGRMGHYMQYCLEVPFFEDKLSNMKKLPFGPWLKAEANEYSPFWELYYGTPVEELLEEEIVPETPVFEGQIVAYEGDPTNEKQGSSTKSNEKRKKILTEELNWEETWVSVHKHVPILSAEKSMMKVHTMQGTMEVDTTEKGKNLKMQVSKKHKRFAPYTSQQSKKVMFDENQLMETPILIMEEDQ